MVVLSQRRNNMGKKSKTQKRIEREEAEKANFLSTPKIPDDAYYDDDGLLHIASGEYIADGVYRDSNDNILMYEGIFEHFGFGERPNAVRLD